MTRYLIVFLLALLVFQGATRWLRRFGVGRLPGDFTVRIGAREYSVPLGSSIVLSLIAMVIGLLW